MGANSACQEGHRGIRCSRKSEVGLHAVGTLSDVSHYINKQLECSLRHSLSLRIAKNHVRISDCGTCPIQDGARYAFATSVLLGSCAFSAKHYQQHNHKSDQILTFPEHISSPLASLDTIDQGN